jgi:hypothetical protein
MTEPSEESKPIYYAYPNWRVANTMAAYPPIPKDNNPLMFPPGEIEGDNINKYIYVEDKGWTKKENRILSRGLGMIPRPEQRKSVKIAECIGR